MRDVNQRGIFWNRDVCAFVARRHSEAVNSVETWNFTKKASSRRAQAYATSMPFGLLMSTVCNVYNDSRHIVYQFMIILSVLFWFGLVLSVARTAFSFLLLLLWLTKCTDTVSKHIRTQYRSTWWEIEFSNTKLIAEPHSACLAMPCAMSANNDAAKLLPSRIKLGKFSFLFFFLRFSSCTVCFFLREMSPHVFRCNLWILFLCCGLHLMSH